MTIQEEFELWLSNLSKGQKQRLARSPEARNRRNHIHAKNQKLNRSARSILHHIADKNKGLVPVGVAYDLMSFRPNADFSKRFKFPKR